MGETEPESKTEKDIRQITANTDTRFGNKQEEKIQTGRNTINGSDTGRVYIPKVDILTGGFPCQPFSHAGRRQGENDDRYLWPEYLRLIRELQPSWIIAENVAGLISMENGKTLEGILDDLENENYQTEIYNIPACGVGAWHKRERIWIVCHSNSSSNRGEIRGSLPEEKKEKIGIREENGTGRNIRGTGNKPKVYEDVSDTISQRGCGRETRVCSGQ